MFSPIPLDFAPTIDFQNPRFIVFAVVSLAAIALAVFAVVFIIRVIIRKMK